jgi:plasmid maintenance system antidote protein VapI
METIIKPHMGQTLRVLLASHGLSHTDFAKKVRMHRQQVSELCTTERWHSRTTWRVAKALKVPVETFLSLNGE